jgi:hypothetical protein
VRRLEHVDGISDAVRSALEAAAPRECLVTYSFKDPQRQAAEDRDRERRDADKLKEYMKSCGLEAWHSHFVKHTCVAHGTLPPKRTLPSRCHPGHASAAIACV